MVLIYLIVKYQTSSYYSPNNPFFDFLVLGVDVPGIIYVVINHLGLSFSAGQSYFDCLVWHEETSWYM